MEHPSGCSFNLIKNKILRAANCWELQNPGMSRFPGRQVTHDAMNRGRVLPILKAYGVGPNLLRVLFYFWDYVVMVYRAEGVFGAPFRAKRGVVQGGPVSLTIFNVMVDAIVGE